MAEPPQSASEVTQPATGQALERFAKKLVGLPCVALLRLSLHLFRSRQVTAMMRIKDEHQFLDAAARSIIECVDELVLVDNQSSDGSREIEQRLLRDYPHKVRLFDYSYDIARRGSEHEDLAASAAGRRSPHLSSNYYNWCLAHCTGPYVLKWDGDMIATPTFHRAVEQWRASSRAALAFKGVNVHRDGQHRVGREAKASAMLQQHFGARRVPNCVRELGFTTYEWRLFPKPGARFTTGVWWTQTLFSPYLVGYFLPYLGLQAQDACYLHMRFCKDDPATGYSQGFAAAVLDGLTTGPELLPEWQESLRRWAAL